MPDNLLSPDRLTAKIGKLPVWAWGVIGATVVLLGYYITRSRKNARVANPTANPSADSANPFSNLFGLATPTDTANALLPDGTSGQSNGGGADVYSTGETNTSIDTNLSWLNKGISIAVQKGNHSALGSTTALQKYLSGLPLNVGEQDVVGTVLSNLGYPPEGAPVMVKIIKDTVGKSDATNPAPIAPKVTPTPTPTPTVTPKAKTGANGYPLDSKGREVIEYGLLDAPYKRKVLSGSLAGQAIPVGLVQKDKIYVGVNKQYIPASPTR